MAGRRRRDGRLVLRLDGGEADLLEQLLDELDELAAKPPGPPGDDPVARLHVAGYADPDAAADFRELTQLSLQSERRDRYAQCRAELVALAASAEGDRALTIEVATASRWLMVLNDMRLALGTRLGVTDAGFADSKDGLEPAEDVEVSQAVYHWLTAVQDGLVTAAMG